MQRRTVILPLSCIRISRFLWSSPLSFSVAVVAYNLPLYVASTLCSISSLTSAPLSLLSLTMCVVMYLFPSLPLSPLCPVSISLPFLWLSHTDFVGHGQLQAEEHGLVHTDLRQHTHTLVHADCRDALVHMTDQGITALLAEVSTCGTRTRQHPMREKNSHLLLAEAHSERAAGERILLSVQPRTTHTHTRWYSNDQRLETPQTHTVKKNRSEIDRQPEP